MRSMFRVLMISSLISCYSGSKTEENIIEQKEPIDSTDLIVQRDLFELGQLMNLTPITKGVDSFELRLWIGSIIVEHDLIIMKYGNSSWKTNKIRYYKNKDGSIHFNEVKINPELPIAILVDSLNKIDFLR